jgi:hypothetical protein
LRSCVTRREGAVTVSWRPEFRNRRYSRSSRVSTWNLQNVFSDDWPITVCGPYFASSMVSCPSPHPKSLTIFPTAEPASSLPGRTSSWTLPRTPLQNTPLALQDPVPLAGDMESSLVDQFSATLSSLLISRSPSRPRLLQEMSQQQNVGPRAVKYLCSSRRNLSVETQLVEG